MNTLTDRELAAVHHCVDVRREKLRTVGLELHADGDLNNWVRHMEQAPGILEVAANLDPARSNLHPGNAYWIYATNEGGDIVACIVEKLMVTEDLLYEVRSHRAFFDKAPVLDWYRVDLCVDQQTPELQGRVSYGGGMWVHPDWRGRAIGNTIPQIGRFLNLRHFDVDWHVSFIADTKKRQSWGVKGVGHANRTPLLKGIFPLYGRERDMQLFYTSRVEIIAEVNLEAASQLDSPAQEIVGIRMRL